jgi:hypothetical protein
MFNIVTYIAVAGAPMQGYCWTEFRKRTGFPNDVPTKRMVRFLRSLNRARGVCIDCYRPQLTSHFASQLASFINRFHDRQNLH